MRGRIVRPARRVRVAIAVLATTAMLGAAPSCALPAVRGRVLDRDTRAPIAGVRVVEQRRSARALSDVAATLHARVAKTDAEGRFVFPAETSASVQVALRGDRAPSYVLAHSRYGLIRSGEREPTEAELAFEMSLSDVTAQQSLASLCEAPPGDPVPARRRHPLAGGALVVASGARVEARGRARRRVGAAARDP